MLEKAEVDCLIVGQTPPPHHGQAVVTGMLFEHDWSKVDVALLRMSYSDTIDRVGSFSLSKVFHLFWLIWQTWKIVFKQSPQVLYYLPSSPHKVPLIRDIIYLTCTRWCFNKTIFHYHAGGLAEFVEAQGILGYLARRVYARADASIELSASGVSPSEYFQAKQRFYIPNGLAVGDNISAVSAVANRLEVLFIGALNDGKGIGQIVETAKLLKDRDIDVHFNIVGAWADEAYKKQILSGVAQHGLEKNVTFAGVLTGAAKWSALSKADCFFFPSHYASESFPLALIEAMAYGLPLVTTDWRGIPNLVGDSGAAYLLPVRSASHYASALAELAVDREKYREMAESARAYYCDHYTKEKFLERMEDVFSSLCSESPKLQV